jgi:hypothetical protein
LPIFSYFSFFITPPLFSPILCRHAMYAAFIRFITLFITLDISFRCLPMRCAPAFALLIPPPIFAAMLHYCRYAACRHAAISLFAIIFAAAFSRRQPIEQRHATRLPMLPFSLSAIMPLSPAIFAATRRYFFRPRRFHLRCAAIWQR